MFRLSGGISYQLFPFKMNSVGKECNVEIPDLFLKWMVSPVLWVCNEPFLECSQPLQPLNGVGYIMGRGIFWFLEGPCVIIVRPNPSAFKVSQV